MRKCTETGLYTSTLADEPFVDANAGFPCYYLNDEPKNWIETIPAWIFFTCKRGVCFF